MLDRVTIFCFLASYGVALALEVLHCSGPGPSCGAGSASASARPACWRRRSTSPCSSRRWPGSSAGCCFSAWILAIFYLYGSLHHARLAWGVFVLPLVLGLVGLGAAFGPPTPTPMAAARLAAVAGSFWGQVHAGLLLLAAVGVCVGFLRQPHVPVPGPPAAGQDAARPGPAAAQPGTAGSDEPPGHHLAFPLLTAGMLIGVVLMIAARPLRRLDRPARPQHRRPLAGLRRAALLRYG